MTSADEFFLSRLADGTLMVCADGTVRNSKTGRFIGRGLSDGVPRVGLHAGMYEGKQKVQLISLYRLMWLAFYGPVTPGKQIVRRDAVQQFCELNNLMEATPKERCVNAVQHGRWFGSTLRLVYEVAGVSPT